MKLVLLALALLFILGTLLPLIQHDQWWIRIFDFPRGQVVIGGLLLLGIYLYAWDPRHVLEGGVLALLVICLLYQVYKIFPYTAAAARQVQTARAVRPDASFSLLIANVLMENRAAGLLLRLIEEKNPDLILTVETDAWWEEQLRALEDRYPYTVKEPLDNTYGMLLHARLELVDPEVKYLVEEDIPSIHTHVRLPEGSLVRLYCLHPEPPYPKEAERTTERDAELLIVGKEVRQHDVPTVVAGDLNDVAWSYTTDLFQEISGLLDPRRGRGMYNTFNAKNILMRWPLDHIFHSEHFKLITLERLPAFGSDHFPVFVHLALDPEAAYEQEKPQAEPEDQEQAEEKIEKVELQAPLDGEAEKRSPLMPS